jgi:hypothetical protein
MQNPAPEEFIRNWAGGKANRLSNQIRADRPG